MSAETSLLLVDDLIKERAAHESQNVVVAYPKAPKGLLDYELLTARDLDRYVDAAVRTLLARNINPITENSKSKTVGLLGPSNLEFIVSMLAWSRLGYTVLILSPRLAVVAYDSLLEATGCNLICHSLNLEGTVSKLQQTREVSTTTILERLDFITSISDGPPFELKVNKQKRQFENAYIMHSSGSTGLPKPIYQTHRACLGNYTLGHGLDTLLTAPLYHTHGHACLFRSIYNCCTTYFLNANLPVTSSNLINVMQCVKPPVVNTVPYTIKLLAESSVGIEALRNCRLVSSSGSPISDELGDRLTSEGVHLVSLFGATETGALMSSMRPYEDKDWSYLSISPSVKPHVWMKPLAQSTFELVALEGLPSKVISNSDEPPNSFHTRDIFSRHPTKENRWKYIGRLDDRVTLSNGEKVLPLPIEGCIREEKLVREAVVFGIDRPFPGVLLFRSEHATDLDDDAFVAKVWPAVQSANTQAESFAQIMETAIVPISAHIDYPRTDKGNVIRTQIYNVFADEIQDFYNRFENGPEGRLKLNQHELESYIITQFENVCSIRLPDVSSDFFQYGLDSLQAIKLARFFRQNLYLGGHGKEFGPDTIFAKSHTALLAKHLSQLQQNKISISENDAKKTMFELIQKYSTFKREQPTKSLQGAGQSILLTGATGSLGAHILFYLLMNTPSNLKVFCLIRSPSDTEAQARLQTSMARWGLNISEHHFQTKITCLASDFSRPDLGLVDERIHELQQSLSSIIHVAWAVNFNLGLSSFEQHHIKGVYNLANLALSVHGSQSARFLFCSSTSVSARVSTLKVVPEKLIESPGSAEAMGYAQSKMVSEHIINNAAKSTGLDARILRIGQIVGSKQSGRWNDTELIPLIIRSGVVLGCLPKLEDSCAWLPVDVVAEAVVDISNATEPVPYSNGKINGAHDAAWFYNVVNPKPFSWSQDLLPALHQSGLEFDTVSTDSWLSRLQQANQDPGRNPILKLLPLLLRRFGKDQKLKSEEHATGDHLMFATERAQQVSSAIRAAPDVINEGYISRFVENWMSKWNPEAS